MGDSRWRAHGYLTLQLYIELRRKSEQIAKQTKRKYMYVRVSHWLVTAISVARIRGGFPAGRRSPGISEGSNARVIFCGLTTGPIWVGAGSMVLGQSVREVIGM